MQFYRTTRELGRSFFGPSLRRLSALALIAHCALCVSAFAQDSTSGTLARLQQKIVVGPRLAMVWQALDVTERSLAQGVKRGGYPAMVGITGDALDALFSTIEGTKLVNQAGGALGGTEITFNNIKVLPGAGALDAEIFAEAKRGPVRLGLTIAASIMVKSVDHNVSDGQGRSAVRLQLVLMPNEVKPSVGVGSWGISAESLWTTILPQLAGIIGKDSLFTRDIYLPNEFTLETGINKIGRENFGEDKSASITYETSMPASKMTFKVVYGAPVYTSNAIWLMGGPESEPGGLLASRPAPSNSADQLLQLIQDLEARNAKQLAEMNVPDLVGKQRAMALRINGTVIGLLSDKFGALPPDARAITIQTTSASGNLAEKRWRDNLLGDGGVSVRLASDRGGRVEVSVEKPEIAWLQDALSLDVPIKLKANADIHGHFDPLIGGGMGTSVGIEGNADATKVRLTARPEVVKVEGGYPIAIARWETNCESIRAEATTDGRFKLSVGWASVPKVGARLRLPAEPGALKPFLLWATQTSMVELPGPTPLAEKGAFADWKLVPAASALKITAVPDTMVVSDKGISASARLDIASFAAVETDADRDKLISELKINVALEQKSIEKSLKQYLDRALIPSRCNNSPEFAVLLGPFEIGPNNEVVKIFGVLLRAAGKLPDAAQAVAPEITVRGNGQIELKVPVPGAGKVEIKTHGDHGGLGVQIGRLKF